MTETTPADANAPDRAEGLMRAVVFGELASLRNGGAGVGGYLESSLTRKMVYRHIINAYYQKKESCIAVLTEFTGQSRQNIAQQVADMMDMGLIEPSEYGDKRRKCIQPTAKLMDYWHAYCLRLIDLPGAREVINSAAAFQNSLATGSDQD